MTEAKYLGTNDELRELIKDAPKFEHMDRSELVAHAYGLYAAGNKVGAENAKLRELVADMWRCMDYRTTAKYARDHCTDCPHLANDCGPLRFGLRAAELGIEVDGYAD